MWSSNSVLERLIQREDSRRKTFKVILETSQDLKDKVSREMPTGPQHAIPYRLGTLFPEFLYSSCTIQAKTQGGPHVTQPTLLEGTSFCRHTQYKSCGAMVAFACISKDVTYPGDAGKDLSPGQMHRRELLLGQCRVWPQQQVAPRPQSVWPSM